MASLTESGTDVCVCVGGGGRCVCVGGVGVCVGG